MAFDKEIFEKYVNEPDLEQWIGFPELMWGLGFEMDCYDSAPEIKNLPWNEKQTEKQRRDEVLAMLGKLPVRVVGNYIFSRYRELTHWSDYGYPAEKGAYFFGQAFQILKEKMTAQQSEINKD